MSESKTVIYSPDSGMAGGNGMMAMLAPLLQQKGIDPNLLVAMNGKTVEMAGAMVRIFYG